MGIEKADNDFTNAKYKKGNVVWFKHNGMYNCGKIIYRNKGLYGVDASVSCNTEIYEIKEEDIMSEPEAKYGNTTAIGAKDPREPAHYDMQISPVEFIEKNKLGFSVGCVIKYVCRYKYKGGREDLKKARHYIDLLLKYEYGE